ncbi:hypothetical protein FIBSPDRAFT_913520 [Athelia psychrophila]|uniref:CxC2-like cysteine cluster KDZ transposase-associated domain-containing protein n=1 Tax=Athelia psychrophila TaxID=1759441 RepID=A0A166APW6_9AGAM|nr:hypothetical protein FIBSPDRAFT_913520 [Fibularhizoctonia sp. CBS 109695]
MLVASWVPWLRPCFQRIIPTAPQTPTTGFHVETLELYRTAHFRCPQLSVQAWVRTMADLQGEVYARYRSRQFSIAYDLYLEIRTNIHSRINKALNREDPNWNIRHICPACMNKVQGEPEMRFSMLWAMDGNDSLKRFERRAAPDEDGSLLGQSVESFDSRAVPGNMYISRADVDRYKMKPGSKNRDSEEEAQGPCRDRWKNMKPEATACSWGCFGETGIFASFCRHGHNLMIADMYCTGEQSKYGLATQEKMMLQHGPNQGAGLDIGCSQMITLANNEELGPLARELNHTMLVDAFHGHAHNRLCQLSNLTTYVEGLGLEKLGVCEQSFSKSNNLAGSTRSMSTFHRKQAIAGYFRDTDDFENFQSTTTYIHTMYKKALDILNTNPTALELSKATLGITGPAPFERWLREERHYLQSLQREPPEETLQLEYHTRLQHLWDCDALVQAVRSVGFQITDPTRPDRTTTPNEKLCRDTIENHANALANVQNLELRLSIENRWTADSAEYAAIGCMVVMCEYQSALDKLEGLVIARLFELISMNRAGMGYKMRKHIGKALQTRSAAIKTALQRYNTAALALNPPHATLKAEEVVEYTFLSDFDLLRDTRQDIRERPWSTAMGRIAMDQYFNLCRAPEEIVRCNAEIVRVVTHLRDESAYLQHHEERLCPMDPVLAYHITIHRNIRGRFNSQHHRRIAQIAALPGFSGSVEPGISLDTGPEGEGPSAEELELDGEQDDDDEEAQEYQDEADVLAVMMDKVGI